MTDERQTDGRGKILGRTDLQREMVVCSIWRCCLNCENYDKTQGCLLSSPVRFPPPEIVVYGCTAWVDCIPF